MEDWTEKLIKEILEDDDKAIIEGLIWKLYHLSDEEKVIEMLQEDYQELGELCRNGKDINSCNCC